MASPFTCRGGGVTSVSLLLHPPTYLQPGTNVKKPLFKDGVDPTVCGGADIKEQVAAGRGWSTSGGGVGGRTDGTHSPVASHCLNKLVYEPVS